MTSLKWAAYSGVAGFTTVALACLIAVGPKSFVPPSMRAALRVATDVVASQPLEQAAPPASAAPTSAAAPAVAKPLAEARHEWAVAAADTYYEQLRRKLRWVQTRIGANTLLTPDLASRVLLAKSAAQRARLEDVGLSFMDVYGIINAETSWVPRLGASKDGTPNLGIAQFEPATARALGLRNPNDPVEAIHVAALHMKEAAIWSGNRIEGLKLDAAERAEKLREGVSIYYNLSSRGRAAWNGRNTRKLPRETQLHILNARVGAREAALLEAQLRAATYRRRHGEAIMTAGDTPSGG